MLSSAVRTFADPEEYAAMMRHATVGLTITQRGKFSAKLSRIDLHRLWLQRFSANLGWTAHIDYWNGAATFAFQTQPGPKMMRQGRECAFTSLTQLYSAQDYYFHSPRPASYATISLSLTDIASFGPTVRMGGQETTERFVDPHPLTACAGETATSARDYL